MTTVTGRHRSERGTGLLGTLFGVGAVLVTIALASNVCIGLWTRSTVEAVAQDAARDLAGSPPGPVGSQRIADVLERARRRLGPTGESTSLVVEGIDDVVTLHVRHPGVSILPRLIDRGPAVGEMDERIVVRREGVR